MTLIRNMAVCQATDFLFYAEEKRIANWNEFHNLIWNDDSDYDHWRKDAFIITANFFNPEYLDDAYGLRWHPKVQEVVQGYMKEKRLKKVLVLTSKNSSLLML